jgi:hypothetical protein
VFECDQMQGQKTASKKRTGTSMASDIRLHIMVAMAVEITSMVSSHGEVARHLSVLIPA